MASLISFLIPFIFSCLYWYSTRFSCISYLFSPISSLIGFLYSSHSFLRSSSSLLTPATSPYNTRKSCPPSFCSSLSTSFFFFVCFYSRFSCSPSSFFSSLTSSFLRVDFSYCSLRVSAVDLTESSCATRSAMTDSFSDFSFSTLNFSF